MDNSNTENEYETYQDESPGKSENDRSVQGNENISSCTESSDDEVETNKVAEDDLTLEHLT